jgi:hypothetical protein
LTTRCASIRAGDHQQGAARLRGIVGAVFDGLALRVVELRQPGSGIGRRGVGNGEHSGRYQEVKGSQDGISVAYCISIQPAATSALFSAQAVLEPKRKQPGR